MTLPLSHWNPGSGVVLDCLIVSIPDLCPLFYFHLDTLFEEYNIQVSISFKAMFLPDYFGMINFVF